MQSKTSSYLASVLILSTVAFASGDERPRGLDEPFESNKAADFLELVQRDKAPLHGGRLDREEYASRCVGIAKHNPYIRLHALMQAISQAPDTSGANDAVNWFIHEFAADPSLTSIDQWLTISPGLSAQGTERLLRAILKKNSERLIRGKACYCLAVNLWSQTEKNASLSARDMEGMLDESVRLFENAIREYGDVPSQGKTIGSLSHASLKVLRAMRPGRPAPPLCGQDLEGELLNLADYRGEVVMLSFWATWCGPCMSAVPLERKIVHQFKGRAFHLLGVCGDDDIQKAKRVAQEVGMIWSSWRNGSTDAAISDSWCVSAWPTIYLIDHKGILRRRFVGFPDSKAIDSMIESLVAECERDSCVGSE